MNDNIQELLIIEIAQNINSEWDKLTINIEIDDIDGRLVSSDDSEVWLNGEVEEFDLTYETSEYFEQLREIMAKNDLENRYWTICDLEVLSDGTFKYKFSYDEPPRLSALKNN
ncbi:antitoxin YezG family protein [Pseudoalteromonas rhizosphaerae]|uniref:DUF600 family protein n=1 Tax=Pseudoalteromonas rhizosphaerae TaxID=2518973 RepID=A0ABW8KVD7_9GAMM